MKKEFLFVWVAAFMIPAVLALTFRLAFVVWLVLGCVGVVLFWGVFSPPIAFIATLVSLYLACSFLIWAGLILYRHGFLFKKDSDPLIPPQTKSRR